MKHLISLAITLLITILIIDAQPAFNWERTINNGTVQCIAVDPAGNVFCAGQICNISCWAFVCKYDSSGNLIWYNEPPLDTSISITKIALDDSCNMYLSATTDIHTASVSSKATCVKYDSSGTLKWWDGFRNSANTINEATDIFTDNNHNVFLKGRTSTYDGSNLHPFDLIRKFSSGGQLLWMIADSSNQGPTSQIFSFDSNDNFYYSSNYTTLPQYHFKLFKYDSAGNKIWEKEDSCFKMSSIKSKFFNGQVYTLITISNSQQSFAIYSYDANGNRLDTIFFQVPSADLNPRGFLLGLSGSIFVYGDFNFPGQASDFFLTKFNSDNSYAWTITQDGGLNLRDQSISAAIDSSENVFLESALNIDYTNNTADLGICKIDSLGNLIWLENYNEANPSFTLGLDLLVKNQNIYVAGFAYGPSLPRIGLVRKYSETLLNSAGSSPVSSDVTLFPNPTTANLTISLASNTTFDHSYIEIINNLGKTVISQRMNSRSIEIDTHTFSSGMYFYRVITDDKTIRNGKFLIL